MGQFDARTKRGMLFSMLFMVIKHFEYGDSKLIGERFKSIGRILPEGIAYYASWLQR